MNYGFDNGWNEGYKVGYAEAEMKFNKPKTAKWILVRKAETVFDGEIERYDIVKCSNCGIERTERTPFCPICGFLMTL